MSEENAENLENTTEVSPQANVIADLEARLAAALDRVEQLENDARYRAAEFQNFRRRKEEEFISQQKYANTGVLKDLLPILDNFDRALQAAEQSQSFEKLIAGVQGIQKQVQSFLSKVGVEPIVTLGEEFNPDIHEAVGYSEESDAPANTITQEVQRGYRLHDRILRPALVKISQG